jgi:hypothetical protein
VCQESGLYALRLLTTSPRRVTTKELRIGLEEVTRKITSSTDVRGTSESEDNLIQICPRGQEIHLACRVHLNEELDVEATQNRQVLKHPTPEGKARPPLVEEETMLRLQAEPEPKIKETLAIRMKSEEPFKL